MADKSDISTLLDKKEFTQRQEELGRGYVLEVVATRDMSTSVDLPHGHVRHEVISEGATGLLVHLMRSEIRPLSITPGELRREPEQLYFAIVDWGKELGRAIYSNVENGYFLDSLVVKESRPRQAPHPVISGLGSNPNPLPINELPQNF